jgi:NTP pyrophosphatase (non-canonical NTP hydrolase)
MEIDDYQRRAQGTDQVPARTGDGMVVALMGLAGEVGTLATDYKKRLRDGDTYRFYADDLLEELGDVLWYVANIAHKSGLSLDDVAQANLAKLADRWQQPTHEPPAYDAAFPETERLPRQLLVDFREDPDTGKVRIALPDGTQLGNDLGDNARVDDGFRYHDVLHLSHLATMGWSPVLRGFLKRKRRSDPRVDDTEDGGRARVTEEGIVAYVFSRAREEGFFEGRLRVDNDVLQTVTRLVGHFEVRDRTPAEWEHTILTGFDVWRRLRENGGGLVKADLDERRLTYLSR